MQLSIRKHISLKCNEILYGSNINWHETTQHSIFLYSVRMRENTDQNNPEYGHFSRSLRFLDFNKSKRCKGNTKY